MNTQNQLEEVPKAEPSVAENPTIEDNGEVSSELSVFDHSKLSPFNLLPDEIIDFLLRYFSLQSLISAVQLDNRFQRLVTQSSRIMKKMPLCVGPTEEMKHREFVDLTRRYQKVNFFNIEHDKWFKNMLGSFHSIGDRVTVATFKDCQLAEIANVLKCFPNIKELNLTAFDYDSNVKFGKITSEMFPKLEKVKIDSMSSILEDLAELQLKELCVTDIYGRDWHHLVNLLKNQRQLNKLTLYEVHDIPDEVPLETMTEVFTVSALWMFRVRCFDVKKLISFLKLFANHAKSIGIVNLEKTADSHLLYETILKDFKKLTKVSIDSMHLPTTEDFFKSLKINRKMEILTILCHTMISPIALRGLVRAFPRISEFGIGFFGSDSGISDEMKAEDFKYMFDNWKRLRSFFPRFVNTDIINRGVFKKITTLIIHEYEKPVNWVEVGKQSSGVRSLVIVTIPPDNQLDLKAIVTNLKFLLVLVLGEGFIMTQAELTILKENAGFLRGLSILESSWKIEQAPKDVSAGFKISLLDKLE